MHDAEQRQRQKTEAGVREDPTVSSAFGGCAAAHEKRWAADKTEQKTDWKQLLWVESFFSPLVSLHPKQQQGNKIQQLKKKKPHNIL